MMMMTKMTQLPLETKPQDNQDRLLMMVSFTSHRVEQR
jgi:hypothetical protein